MALGSRKCRACSRRYRWRKECHSPRCAALRLPRGKQGRGTSLTGKFDQIAWPYCSPTKVMRPSEGELPLRALLRAKRVQEGRRGRHDCLRLSIRSGLRHSAGVRPLPRQRTYTMRPKLRPGREASSSVTPRRTQRSIVQVDSRHLKQSSAHAAVCWELRRQSHYETHLYETDHRSCMRHRGYTRRAARRKRPQRRPDARKMERQRLTEAATEPALCSIHVGKPPRNPSRRH